jgi:signal transduction histidine kinase
MSRTLATVPLATAADVASARLDARRLAELIGLERQSQTRIATAVSEIARNAIGYAGGGSVAFEVDDEVRPQVFIAVVRDRGPGIAALEAILDGQHDSVAGHAGGLINARRLVDRFEVESSASGTLVRLSQHIPRAAAARLSPAVLASIGAWQPRRVADPIAMLNEQNRELIESLNALQERQAETIRLNRELEDTNRGVVALYSELDQRAEQLRSASEMKSRFLSHMSHEFRTPLNSILALSRLLIDGIDGALTVEQGRQVEYIRKSAQSLLEMVNDLLDLSKVEAGKVDVRPVEFTIASLFAALRGALRPLQVNPEVELVFEDAQGLPEVFADDQKVAQVLRNFVSNALKFTERGQVRVGARLDARREHVVISVHDTGIGIAAQDINLIFEEFAQVDGRLQRGGTGLGLPLSRRLAQLMGGDIAAHSQPDVGSTFELIIPLRFGQPSAAAMTTAAKRVLVVDDEEAFRYVIRHIAQDAGHEVMEAPDGETGMRFALEQRPDIIFLDLHMPRMDGFTMLDRLAASGLRATPVVVCSSHPLTLEQKRSLSGAYAIVPKRDISRDGLAALIQAAEQGAPA